MKYFNRQSILPITLFIALIFINAWLQELGTELRDKKKIQNKGEVTMNYSEIKCSLGIDGRMRELEMLEDLHQAVEKLLDTMERSSNIEQRKNLYNIRNELYNLHRSYNSEHLELHKAVVNAIEIDKAKASKQDQNSKTNKFEFCEEAMK